MYVEVQWNVDAFSLSLIFPASRWTFFSEQDPTKYVIKPLLLTRLTVIDFTFQWKCQVSLVTTSKASSYHE